MQRKIEFIIKMLIVATFIVPLVVVADSFIFPFIVPKILLFRSIVQVMLALYLTLLVTNFDRYKPKMNWLSWAVLGFFVSFAVSTFVGVDWYKSLWDNHERMLGLFTITHYVIYYFIVAAVVKSREEWVWLFRAWLFVGGIVMVLGIVQYWDNEFLLNRGSGRSASTLGNSIYYSGYGLFLFSIALYLFVGSDRKWNFWQYYTLLGGTLGFLGVFFGQTRGTLVGLICGMGVVGLLYFITTKSKKVRMSLGVVAITLVALGGLLYMNRTSEFVSKIPNINRLVTTQIHKGTANTRFMAWGMAVEAWKEAPAFGWGPNNYYYAFNKFYRPEFLRSGWSETWFDNAHNVVMNTLATQGAIGLVLYFGLFGVAIYSIWVGYGHQKNSLDVAIIGTGFLVAHFIHNVFVFENPTSYLFFFFILAFFTEGSYLGKEDVKGAIDKNVSFGVLALTLVVSALFVYSTNYNPKQANNASLNLIRVVNTDPLKGAVFFKESLKIPTPHIDDIRNDSTRTLASLATMMINAGKKDEAREVLTLAIDELDKNKKLHPMDIRVHLQQAQTLAQLAQLDNSVSYMVKAENIVEEAIGHSPRRQQLYFTLAPIKLQLGKTAEAVEVSVKARDLDPVIAEAWWRLAAVYSDTGESAKALETVQEMERTGLTFINGGEEVRKAVYDRARSAGLLPPEPEIL
jgi:O-antigen ligase